jgi:hypothetical protein
MDLGPRSTADSRSGSLGVVTESGPHARACGVLEYAMRGSRGRREMLRWPAVPV